MNSKIQTDFDAHWKKNFSESIPQIKIQEAEKFFGPVIPFLRSREFRVFEAGCGDGVHWTFIKSLKNDRLSYTGIDISANAINRLKKKNDQRRDRFLQMDLAALSEPEKSYDIVFAFGVVAYTQSPERSFTELCRICKQGGWIGVWVYPEPQGLSMVAFKATRRICRIVGPFLTRRIADIITPFIGLLPTRSKINLINSSWKECREVILVNIAPKKLVFIKRDEILFWFRKHHIKVEYEDRDNPITLWGRKE